VHASLATPSQTHRSRPCPWTDAIRSGC
jgi:hypothetical protein